MGATMGSMPERLLRRKRMPLGTEMAMMTRMNRCLSTFDITLLGVGHMIGAGIYVLTGAVVRNTAGPGVVLSFILAGIASLLSALCYAEFGARVPNAGSAYAYTYVTVGEFWAFIIGWNIILEHMLGAAAVARSWSGYLDSLVGHLIRNNTIVTVDTLKNASVLFGVHPDLVAFLVVIVVVGFTAFGAKSSTNFNSIFTGINICVIGFVILVGFVMADTSNWSNAGFITADGEYIGGFLPYGFKGVISGSAICFFAYIGFDGLATAGEEASDPSKSIPRATFIAMSIVTAAYVLMSASLTMLLPFYKVHPTAAFSDAFEQRGLIWAKYVVAVGAISGMTTSILGSMFALPRCIYAMANDGLLFAQFASIHQSTQVPMNAVVVFGCLTAIIALLIDIETLVEFLSIGTLMAYTIVSCSVIILRYQPAGSLRLEAGSSDGRGDDLIDNGDTNAGRPKQQILKWLPYLDRLFPISGSCVSCCVAAYTIASVVGSVLFRCWSPIDSHASMIIFFVCIIVSTISFVLICFHNQSISTLSFKVPLVPLVPCLSITVNVVLMLYLHWLTWIRLVVWLFIGFLIYFLYGMKHSKEGQPMSGAGEGGLRENGGSSRSNTYSTLVSTPATTPTATIGGAIGE